MAMTTGIPGAATADPRDVATWGEPVPKTKAARQAEAQAAQAAADAAKDAAEREARRPGLVQAMKAKLAGLAVGDQAKRLAARRAEYVALKAGLARELDTIRGKLGLDGDAEAHAEALLDPQAPSLEARRALRDRAAAIVRELADVDDALRVLAAVEEGVLFEDRASQAGPVVKKYLKACDKLRAELERVQGAIEDLQPAAEDLAALWRDLSGRSDRLMQAGQVGGGRMPFDSSLSVLAAEWRGEFVPDVPGNTARFTAWVRALEAAHRRFD
jgi:hypothetical protein